MSRTGIVATGKPSYRAGRAPSLYGLRETALALRLFALAVACASGSLLAEVSTHPARFLAGILIGVLLALLQHVLLQRAPRVASPALVGPHLLVWTYLVAVSGGSHSPLIAGYLLEVPLSGALMGRLGVVIAAAGGALAIFLVEHYGERALPWSTPLAAIGFIGLAALLTSWLMGVVERQRREIETSHQTLRRSADGLADELRLLGDYMSGGLVTIDETGRVVRINPAGAELLGVAPSAAAGRAWQEVLCAEGEGRGLLAEAVTGDGEARALHLLLATRSRTLIGVDASVWSGASHGGRRTYVLLSPPPAEADGADPLRRLGEAAASVSHQIRNSLHVLQGFAGQIAAESNGDAGGAAAADQLQFALGTLGELAEDVLAMSGAARPEEAVPLAPVLASAVTLARRTGVQIEVHGPPPATRVRAHRGRLVHALFNLIDNACRATPQGEIVEVTMGACESLVWVEICDRGPGPPIAAARQATPRFAGTGAGLPAGSGIGLAATRRFLESFGAELDFMPREGGGSRCRVRLLPHHPTTEAAPVPA